MKSYRIHDKDANVYHSVLCVEQEISSKVARLKIKNFELMTEEEYKLTSNYTESILPTVADYSAAIQQVMDEAAQANGFDNIFTAVTYADEDSVPSFKAHGLALRAWRSLVWDSAYTLMAQVESGEMPQPTIADLIAMLPAFEV